MDAAMEARLALLEARLCRQEDFRELTNLMGRYQYLHTGGEMDRIGRELFAWDAPDAHSEYGPLGVFYGKKCLDFFDAVKEQFCHGKPETDPGLLEIHQITTPVLEIAEDGQTAKGMWMSTGAIMMRIDPESETGCSFTWDTGKYAVDFLKVDGVWKIWHLHVCDMWRAAFDEDPVANAGGAPAWTTQEMIDGYNRRAAAGEDVRPFGFPIPDAPTTFHYAYNAESPAPREPRPPVPYRTFSETFSY